MQKPNLDGLENIITGLGIEGRDKRVVTTFTHYPLTETEVDDLYSASPMARKIVDKLPEEALRRGIEFTGIEPDDAQDMQDYIYGLKVLENLKLGLQWGRKYGGAMGMFCVEDGLTPDQPLDLTRIRSLKSILVLSRWELYAQSTDRINNHKDPDYGWPRYYTLLNRRGMMAPTYDKKGRLPKDVLDNGVKIHYSRLVRFDGVDVGPRKRSLNGYWNDSILTGMEDALKDYSSSHSNVATLIHDFNVAVMTLKNLEGYIASHRESDIEAFFKIQAYAKSVIGIMPMREGDTYDVKARNVTGLDEMIDRLTSYLVSLTEYPHTALLNESPKDGLGGKGESQQNTFYDTVQGYQETTVTSKLDSILQVAFSAKDNPFNGAEPEEWDYRFPPLKQPSSQDEAVTKKTNAEADQIYVDMGADPKAIIQQRFGGNDYKQEIILKPGDFKEVEPQPLTPVKPEEAAKAAKEAKNVLDVMLDEAEGKTVTCTVLDRKVFTTATDAKKFVADCGITLSLDEAWPSTKYWVFGKLSQSSNRTYSPLRGTRIFYGKLG